MLRRVWIGVIATEENRSAHGREALIYVTLRHLKMNNYDRGLRKVMLIYYFESFEMFSFCSADFLSFILDPSYLWMIFFVVAHELYVDCLRTIIYF